MVACFSDMLVTMFQHFYAVYEIKLDNDNLIHFLLFFNEKKSQKLLLFSFFLQYTNNTVTTI